MPSMVANAGPPLSPPQVIAGSGAYAKVFASTEVTETVPWSRMVLAVMASRSPNPTTRTRCPIHDGSSGWRDSSTGATSSSVSAGSSSQSNARSKSLAIAE